MMPEIIAARERQKRNLLATLLLSQGVPMICGGDEICRTQQGNNNAYCQDNEVSWYDWKLDDRRLKFLDFTRKLIALRRSHPNLRRRKFYQDREVYHSSLKDIAWYKPDGEEMTEQQWSTGWKRNLAVMFNGNTLDQAMEPISLGSVRKLTTWKAVQVKSRVPLRDLVAAAGILNSCAAWAATFVDTSIFSNSFDAGARSERPFRFCSRHLRAVFFVGVSALLVYALVRYRARPGDGNGTASSVRQHADRTGVDHHSHSSHCRALSWHGARAVFGAGCTQAGLGPRRHCRRPPVLVGVSLPASTTWSPPMNCTSR